VQNPEGHVLAPTFTDAAFPVATPVIIEVVVTRILDREKFRRLCDRYGAPDAVVRALQ
jgi:hypothetical protein